MPTTAQEAVKIVEIVDNYLTQNDASQLFSHLYRDVGAKSENQSVRLSLEMLNVLCSNDPKKDEKLAKLFNSYKTRTWHLWTLLITIVFLHAFVIVANIAAFFILPFVTPWYISLPLMTWLANLMVSPVDCPATALEDKIRTKLGLPRIGRFIRHYVVGPYRKLRS